MKWLSLGMRKQAVIPFMSWLEENNISYSQDVFESDNIVNVFYKPVGREQLAKCNAHIEYLCNNDLI